MKAMILAAGLGTRLKPWTDHHPKALAEVNGKSLLQRNVEHLQSHGIKDVIINVHHFANQIQDAIAQNNGWGSNIVISDESNEVLETGGGLWKAQHLLAGANDFVVMNVDMLTNLDLTAMIAAHQSKTALATLAITNRQSSRVFLWDEHQQLCGWRNKQTNEEKIKLVKENLQAHIAACCDASQRITRTLMQWMLKTRSRIDAAQTRRLRESRSAAVHAASRAERNAASPPRARSRAAAFTCTPAVPELALADGLF